MGKGKKPIKEGYQPKRPREGDDKPDPQGGYQPTRDQGDTPRNPPKEE